MSGQNFKLGIHVMTIGIREFSRNIYKYIKVGENITVTAKGNILFKVVFDVTTKEHISQKPEKVVTTGRMEFCSKHGSRKITCGCK